MTRKLRIAASVIFGVLAVALCVLWVRSYWIADLFDAFANQSYSISSLGGHVWIAPRDPAVHTANSAFWMTARVDTDGNVTMPVEFYWANNLRSVVIPFWIPVLILLDATALPWLNLEWSIGAIRFSLRTLLIATTLVAVVLGLAVWVGR